MEPSNETVIAEAKPKKNTNKKSEPKAEPVIAFTSVGCTKVNGKLTMISTTYDTEGNTVDVTSEHFENLMYLAMALQKRCAATIRELGK